LLDASLLRFALSEHFINVDELISRTQGGASGAAVKKKLPVEAKPAVPAPISPAPVPPSVPAPPPREEPEPPAWQLTAEPSEPKAAATATDLIEAWPGILAALGDKLGNGTASLMTGSSPRQFKGDTLIVDFPAKSKIQKEMCESNGRTGQIESVLREHFGRPIRIKFEMIAEPTSESTTVREKPNGQNRREILNDPAVKTVLLGLDATITGIEEV
jgi:hypothetical protein